MDYLLVDRTKRIDSIVNRGADISETLVDLHRSWEQVERAVPPKAAPESRFLFELAETIFENEGRVSDAYGDPAAVRLAYDMLENRYLLSPTGGRHGVLSAIRYGVLHAPCNDGDQVMPREAVFSCKGLSYQDVQLRVLFPPAAIDAHRGQAKLYVRRAGAEALLGDIPVSDITEYRRAGHSIEALARIHRHARRGAGAMVTYGDWYSADGHGRELGAAMVAGLVSRHGEEANGMGGVSPLYSLTAAGRAWLLQHDSLERVFAHFNGIEKSTAYLTGSYGTVAFDTGTGAVLGRYGDPNNPHVPAYIDIPNCAAEIQSGQTYDVLALAYYTVDGLYEPPAPDLELGADDEMRPGM